MIRKLLIKINDFNQSQWLIVSFLSTTSGVWFSLILGFFGTALKLTSVDENGKISFTFLGFILTMITVGWSFISLVAQRYNDYHSKNLGISQENLGNTEIMYDTLNNSSTTIIEKGLLEKLSYIDLLLSDKDHTTPLMPIKKPCNSLNNITAEMVSVLPQLLSYKKYNLRSNDLNVNIYYSFPLDDDAKWYKAHSPKQDKGLTIEQLLQANTTFFEALHSENHYAFYNDKKIAKQLNRYVEDSEDDKDLNGSIACYYYEIVKSQKVYIRFMITIATYGKKFSKKNSDQENNTIALNLKRCVLPEYEMLTKSALADLYVTHLLADKNIA